MAESIPLFPLQALLFPGGEITLQIFEPRYLDMIKRCMRDDSGFGVVGIRAGSEVAGKDDTVTKLVQVGTYARIVDWDALENGMLGIVARGGEKFRILNVDTQPDHLVVAEVEFLAAEQSQSITEEHQHLAALLSELIKHPSVAHMQLSVDAGDALQISNLLGQLLPVNNQAKYELLRCTDPLQRLALISDIVANLSGK